MSTLRGDIETRLARKPILLMTHLVLGYPSLAINRAVIRQMAENGVDCIELQIPFSEPMADGPVILKANQAALANNITVAECFLFAEEMVARFPLVNFFFMTYYNIIYKYGEERFIKRSSDMGMKGIIVPDLPPEEGVVYLEKCMESGIAPIMFFTPTSTDARMVEVSSRGSGFIYCVARRGVTGKQTHMDDALVTYLERCRRATDLPLAVGFGVSSRHDVAMLKGRADLAVIGTATIKLVDNKGVDAVAPFIKGLSL